MKRDIITFALLAALLAIAAGPNDSAEARPRPDPHATKSDSLTGALDTPLLLAEDTEVNPTGYHNPAVTFGFGFHHFLVMVDGTYIYQPHFIAGDWVYEEPGTPYTSPILFELPNPAYRQQPAVAHSFKSDQYLVVYMYDPSGTFNPVSPFEIRGAIQPNQEKVIWKWANRGFWSPRVAWNSIHDSYFVVWNAIDTNTGQATDVAGTPVSLDGTVSSAATIFSATGWPRNVDVTYNLAMDEYLVVWQEVGADSTYDIRGARVGADGTIKRPSFPIAAMSKDQLQPSVTTNQQGMYFVTWEHTYSSSDNDIYGQELNVYGDPVGNAVGISTWTENDHDPVAVAKPGTGKDIAVFWQRTQTTGDEVWGYHLTHSPSEPPFRIGSDPNFSQGNPAVAIGEKNYLIVYEQWPLADPYKRDVYAQRWSPEGSFLPFVKR